jgi:hypothetical protein
MREALKPDSQEAPSPPGDAGLHRRGVCTGLYPCIFAAHSLERATDRVRERVEANCSPPLHLLFVISRFSKLKAAPLCEVIQKDTYPLSLTLVQVVFDMKHELVHISSNNVFPRSI